MRKNGTKMRAVSPSGNGLSPNTLKPRILNTGLGTGLAMGAVFEVAALLPAGGFCAQAGVAACRHAVQTEATKSQARIVLACLEFGSASMFNGKSGLCCALGANQKC